MTQLSEIDLLKENDCRYIAQQILLSSPEYIIFGKGQLYD